MKHAPHTGIYHHVAMHSISFLVLSLLVAPVQAFLFRFPSPTPPSRTAPLETPRSDTASFFIPALPPSLPKLTVAVLSVLFPAAVTFSPPPAIADGATSRFVLPPVDTTDKGR
ncbi:hypothetical protein NGA_0712200 [Nannochloropsis gaditana CCMP526]|uniref:uncharacterized protein n=1 Tax=Nannochloropsis gaditana (strain CCMP526) TaxID=1093141 RepID=UPI00029F6D66|nr:hypothetical protein NGA_0712200 [Nannochloropsis gaditana CCMP526]EKU23415.1 hypothetical protein NGA_0712200 [Nannochloropsis gaditana CCMP526]|eukprot:XP_005852417.1 hypothetical protein NGA_0712200 [Nannochloropsis gaditana CCMP526]